MARPREFDLDEILDAAMDTFWHRGYEATSLADLMVATGLKKGSIYKAFKDKHSLFLQALGRYLNQAYQFHRTEMSKGSSPRERLRNWLQRTLEVYGDYSDCRGCFGVNSLVELAPHDDEVKKLLQNNNQRLQQLLTQTIAEGQASGEFRQDANAADLALLLLYILTGMFTSLKASISPEVMKHQADLAITVLL
jgi:TetR/AcrR family transcriptional repressor of nem operon